MANNRQAIGAEIDRLLSSKKHLPAVFGGTAEGISLHPFWSSLWIAICIVIVVGNDFLFGFFDDVFGRYQFIARILAGAILAISAMSCVLQSIVSFCNSRKDHKVRKLLRKLNPSLSIPKGKDIFDERKSYRLREKLGDDKDRAVNLINSNLASSGIDMHISDIGSSEDLSFGALIVGYIGIALVALVPYSFSNPYLHKILWGGV